MKPKNIDLINNILALVWEDGHESYFEAESLRRHCPCAGCQGEKNIMVEYKPAPPTYTADSFTLARWEFVGGYAIQPHWKDGHASGIYAFDYLRQMCPCEECQAAGEPGGQSAPE